MRKTTTRRKSNANIVHHSNVCSDNEKQKSCPSIRLLSSGLSVGYIIIESVLEGFVPT